MVVYGAVLIAIVFRRDWRDVTARRLAFYLLFAMLAQGTLMVLSISGAAGSEESPVFKIYLYAQSTLLLFFLAFARAFIHIEQKPWAFLIGLVWLIAVIAVDLLRVSSNLVSGIVSTEIVVFVLRTVLWAYVGAYVIVLALVEHSRTRSPLYRNRLAFLAMALPFLFGYDTKSIAFFVLAHQQ